MVIGRGQIAVDDFKSSKLLDLIEELWALNEMLSNILSKTTYIQSSQNFIFTNTLVP